MYLNIYLQMISAFHMYLMFFAMKLWHKFISKDVFGSSFKTPEYIGGVRRCCLTVVHWTTSDSNGSGSIVTNQCSLHPP